jgi:hypothetical protein
MTNNLRTRLALERRVSKRRAGILAPTMPGPTKPLLEAHGLVERALFAEVPVRVEYRLTALGRSLLTPLEGLARWSLEFDRSRAAAKGGALPVQAAGSGTP